MSRITAVWLVVSVSVSDGKELICSIEDGDRWWPMIATDERALNGLRKKARLLARSNGGKRIRLIKLTDRSVEEIE